MPQALRQIPQWINGLDIWTREHLAWLAEQPRLAAAFLVLLCLALYLPGIATLPVTDRDEARFAQASKQMLETGNYVDIRFQENPRYKKPIGIYWLQSASVKTLSPGDFTQIWAYRVPSLLGIIVGVLLTWWAALPIFGRKNALLAAALLASALTLTMPREEFLATLEHDLASIPYVTGVNNHMGSLLTRDPTSMRWLMGSLREADLYFIDSRTITENK
ncbi:MAG: divergent polysaccharide deacetylase family protein, partial [Alphaproteobacteria bacterium]